ncbi:MAG: MBL fold metallo-hydrolase, partial [Chloroflexi bacterium]|nr:MBL fold metallo-hydrolase [Chloroflexota bacterium]
MTQQSQDRQIDMASARDLPPEQAGFFYLGPSKQVAEGVVFLSSFANVTAFTGDDGVLLIDTSQERFTGRMLQDLRDNYSKAPVEAVVYTHGHVDHVTGA